MDSSARGAKQRAQALEVVGDRLRPDETVIAVLAFASTPKRPKGPGGKVREGIYISSRRYRPLVVTNRRLFVLAASRTPYARGVMADFPLSDVGFVDVVQGPFKQSRLLLDLPDLGTVPFDLGRYDVDQLPEVRAALEGS